MPTIDNVGVEIFYEVAGSGPPLVLQHGRLGRGRFWRDVGYVDALERDRTMVILDARGHGRSGKPHDPGSYGAKDMASDVVAVLDRLGIDRADFFGYSMGGRIGFMAAAHFGERFNALIAGGAGPYGPAISPEAELALAETLSGGIAAYVSGLEQMLDRTIPDADRTVLLDNDAEALAALAKAGADWPIVVDEVATAGLPVQLFGGTADPVWPLIEQAHGQLPASALHAFTDLGHGEDIRRPALVLPVVTSFLGRHGLTAR